jgi:hypothetical protein
MLLETFTDLLHQSMTPVFAQQRTVDRAVEHGLSLPLLLGRRTVSRTLCALGRSDQDWSADYKLFSRSSWEVTPLFDPILEEYLAESGKGPIPVGLDDSGYAKTGKQISGAHWQRDPLSPPFHVNLRWGLRFLQASLLFAKHKEEGRARAVPVRFEQAPVVKKPGQRATREEKQQYRKLKKRFNLSTQALAQLQGLRERFDQKHAQHRSLLAVLDGSFCNRILFRADWERTGLLARCRKDARLCRPALQPSPRRYDPQLFTPEQVRQDPQILYRRLRVYYGGRRRWVRAKVVPSVLWRRGAGTRPLRLIVLAPQSYRRTKQGRLYYRNPAYLLTTDLKSGVKHLVQSYLDRWQIEVNHRDQKTLLGVGQAQVRSPRSVPRHPALAVASYALLQVAAFRCLGPGRGPAPIPLPKWRKKSSRYSVLDLLTLLRREMIDETSISGSSSLDRVKNLLLFADT